jgi:hypothetical protein
LKSVTGEVQWLPGMECRTCLIEGTKHVVSVVNSVRSEAVMAMVVELNTSMFKDATNFGEEISWKTFILKCGKAWEDTL